jgi:hypothetical protein
MFSVNLDWKTVIATALVGAIAVWAGKRALYAVGEAVINTTKGKTIFGEDVGDLMLENPVDDTFGVNPYNEENPVYDGGVFM